MVPLPDKLVDTQGREKDAAAATKRKREMADAEAAAAGAAQNAAQAGAARAKGEIARDRALKVVAFVVFAASALRAASHTVRRGRSRENASGIAVCFAGQLRTFAYPQIRERMFGHTALREPR